jgi:transposase
MIPHLLHCAIRTLVKIETKSRGASEFCDVVDGAGQDWSRYRKNTFVFQGFDTEGRTVSKAGVERAQIASFPAEFERCGVGLEACASAHDWAREIAKPGHVARLVPAKAILRQKDDAADAR